jgi:hypothetical protein
MKQKKPLAPWLLGRYGRMTQEELDRESDQYDVEFSALRERRVPHLRPHPRKRGRPPKGAADRASRVLVTIAPQLLAAADEAAEKRGLTRSGLIRRAILDWLERQERRRKSA